MVSSGVRYGMEGFHPGSKGEEKQNRCQDLARVAEGEMTSSGEVSMCCVCF